MRTDPPQGCTYHNNPTPCQQCLDIEWDYWADHDYE